MSSEKKHTELKRKIIRQAADFRPPLAVSIVGAVVFSALSLVIVATDLLGDFPAAVSYAVYVCAAVFLALAVWALILLFRKHSPKQVFMDIVHRNPLSSKVVDDFSFRTMLTAGLSLLMNLLLTAFKLLTGIYYGSLWLIVLSGYYIVIIAAKFILLNYGRKQSKLNDKREIARHSWKAYRICGIMLFVLTTFLTGVITMIVRDGNGFSYNEIIVIAIAAYDFYCLGSAVYYMIAKRKSQAPIVNSIKSISLAASMVAILSLQTAMFASFGGEEKFSGFMNAATGFAVCSALIVLGILIIRRSNKELRKLKADASEELK